MGSALRWPSQKRNNSGAEVNYSDANHVIVRSCINIIRASVATGLLISCTGIADAAETARLIYAPAPVAEPAPKLAAQFELKLVLREGKGLARQLLDAGIDQKDAAAAARLAAGHLGDGASDCFAKVSVVRVSANGGFSLV